MSSNQAQFAFFGAAPDTTNRGVSALFRSVVEGIGTALPESRLLAFDNGTGFRSASVDLPRGADFAYERVGARGGRRYFAPENLATMASVAQLGPKAVRWHPILAELARCQAILDVSGGDSFSDIYGPQRFWSVVRPKLIASRLRVPLVLLPQTYGPFQDATFRGVAREAVLGATMAWARDPRSFQALQALLGDRFDPGRHREGVDMAFTLRPKDPEARLSAEVRQWIEERGQHPLIGINVSGLVALDAEEARRRFGLKADYPAALVSFIQSVLADPERRALLIPHVMSQAGSPESDVEACRRIQRALPPELQARVKVTSTELDECEVKWLISNLNWFCGMRMHSTIAGLSSKVPTVAVAYSDKTRGVFETCDVGDQVIDPRRLDTREVAARLVSCWEARADVEKKLATSIERVKGRASEQFAKIVETLKNGLANPRKTHG